jgi:hypothetical protein
MVDEIAAEDKEAFVKYKSINLKTSIQQDYVGDLVKVNKAIADNDAASFAKTFEVLS